MTATRDLDEIFDRRIDEGLAEGFELYRERGWI
jgi:hypothetical protein